MVSLTTLRISRSGALILAALFASGCSSLYQVDCSSADWFSVGFNDGTNGVDASWSDRHVNACGQSGNQFDTDRYQLGHENGLERYCTTESGLEAGLSGRAYRGVCAEDTERRFLSGYLLGSASRHSR